MQGMLLLHHPSWKSVTMSVIGVALCSLHMKTYKIKKREDY
jgi:hypothetical protein